MWWAIGKKVKTYAYGAVGLTVVAMAFILVYYKHKSEMQATELKQQEIQIMQLVKTNQEKEDALKERQERIEKEYKRYAEARTKLDNISNSDCMLSNIDNNVVEFLRENLHNNR